MPDYFRAFSWPSHLRRSPAYLYHLLRSESTLSELARVLERAKFDRYLTRYERMVFLDRFIQDTVHVHTRPAILASRDVKDQTPSS